MPATPMPTMPVMGQYPTCGQPVQYETCCQVVEPPVACNPQQHHYHRVDHIKPVVIRNVEHHHTHHNYITNVQPSNEAYYYDEYLASQTVVNPTTVAAPVQVSQVQQVNPMMSQTTVTQQAVMNNSFGGYPQGMVNTQQAVTPQAAQVGFPQYPSM